MHYCTKALQTNIYNSAERCHLRWVVSKKESSWSKFVHIATWLPLVHWILDLLKMSPGRCHSAIGSWTLWGCSWFISPSFDLHFPIGELYYLHQCAKWIRNPRKLLNSLPQSHVIARYLSKIFSFEQVWWVIYSPSLLLIPRGHFSFVVLFIFLNSCLSRMLLQLSGESFCLSKESSYFPESLSVPIFIIQRVKKHVEYPALVSCQPGVITQFW